MAAEQQPLDITALPELSRLADEVQQTRQPRVWRRGDRDVAVLAGLTDNDPVARTAGILHTNQPFPGYAEEEEQAAAAIAADIVAAWERE
jgi:hypothetical protein